MKYPQVPNIKKKQQKKKKTFRLLVFCTILGMIPTGCQKEAMVDDAAIVSNAECCRMVGYTIDGQYYRVELRGDEAWKALLERFQAMAMAGHQVVFWNEKTQGQSSATKETLTYTTSNEKDAMNWCEQKFNEGYKVSMTYDPQNNVFICIAIR